jgi:hypothetical protein
MFRLQAAVFFPPPVEGLSRNSASLHASGPVLPWLTDTSICRSFPTVCSGVNIFIGIFSGSFRSSSLYPTGTEIPDGQVTSAYWSKF